MISRAKVFLAVLASILSLGAIWSAQAQSGPTTAGSSIENQAAVTFTAPDGQSRVAFSNVARSTVQQVYAIQVKPDAGNAPTTTTSFTLPPDPSNDRAALAGSSLNFAYTVTNTGNGPDQIALSVLQSGTDDFDLSGVKLYRDLNGNGQLDAGEPEITAPLTVAALAREAVIAVAQVPPTQPDGASARIDLIGRSIGDPSVLDDNNIARVTVSRDANLSISKSALGPDASGRIEYTIQGSNLGRRAARSLPGTVIVDGVLTDGILISDAIPTGTSLDINTPAVGNSGGVGGTMVVYFINSAWTMVPNGSASRVGLLIRDAAPTTYTPQDALPSGSSYSLRFTVQLGSLLPGGAIVTNVATIQYGTSTDATVNTPSNTTFTSVPARSGARIGPFGQPDGAASGSYSLTDQMTGLSWVISRSGDGASATDQQVIASVTGTRFVIFKNTVRNTGNLTDTFNVTPDLSLGGAHWPPGTAIEILSGDGVRPFSSVTLEPGREADVSVRLTLPTTITALESVNLPLRTTSSLNPLATDITRDRILQVSPSIPSYFVWIGPLGQPTATEYPNLADRQAATSFEGTPVTFTNTVLNAGNTPDRINLSLETPLPNGWKLSWWSADGIQELNDHDGDGLPDLGPLAPGESANFMLHVTPPAGINGDNNGSGWNIAIRATSSAQPSMINRTLDTITVLRPVTDAWAFTKSVATSRVQQGATIGYSFSLENTSGATQSNVTVQDALEANLSSPLDYAMNTIQDAKNSNVSYPVSVSFDPTNRAITWRFPSLPDGASLKLAFKARALESTPDATTITNRGTVSSAEIPLFVSSNAVQTDVIGAILQLEKIALQPSVSIGSSLDYELRVRNASASVALMETTVTDTMPIGLAYRSGSSQLDGNAILDPIIGVQNGRQVLTWNIGHLDAQTTLRLRFSSIATPALPERVVNQATAAAHTNVGAQVQVTSNQATASVKREEGVFTRRSAIVGRVYFDADDDGSFTPGTDEPLPGARVYLSTGRYAITDQEGRYSFAELEAGSYALRLDPITVPFTPRTDPANLGKPGTSILRLDGPGLFNADFRLEPPIASATRERQTTLRMGAIELHKTIQPGGAGYAATITLHLETPVAAVRLTDPIPAGAERRGLEIAGSDGRALEFTTDGDTILLGALEPGVYVIRYALICDLTEDAAFTDPDLDWDDVLMPAKK